MNTVWSEEIQGVQTLYLSRRLRFDDCFFGQYEKAFGLDRNAPLKILEIGCGPGALCESLRRWYPNARITGIDRDHNFIAFAKKKISGVEFLEADATKLPFADDSFDVTISYTVSEHIEPTAFFGEQFRVLKPDGVCLCLSSRKGLRCLAPCLATTPQEKAFWDSFSTDENPLETYGVGKYAMSEAEIPATLAKNGFSEVATAYALIDLTPDDPKYREDMALAMIEAERIGDLEAIESMHAKDTDAVIKAVNAKYDERIRLYKKGEKQWDTAVSVNFIVRGVK